MSDKYDGGQAFPVPIALGPMGDTFPAYDGMTLRDWFAGQSIIGLLSVMTPGPADEKSLARNAYIMADAMLVERGK